MHLIVSLHLHAFGFAALTIALLLGMLPPSPLRSAGKLAITVWIAAYLVLALRRVYGGRLSVTALRAAALAAIYAAVSITMVGLMALGLVLLY